MSDLKHTRTRHQVLTFVAVGELRLYQHPGSTWDGLISGGSRLTEAGDALLSEWDTKYGKVAV